MHPYRFLRPFSFLILTLLSFVALAQNKMLASDPNASYRPPVFTDADRLEKLSAYFPLVEKLYKDYAAKNHFPGYAFGIMLDGKLVFSGGGGYTDIEKKIPATTRSMFRIASMSKSFTSMAILKLRDEGKLKLDDPVYLYIPEMKGQKMTKDAPEITIRHLLTHSAGFPEDNPWGDRQLADTDAELIAMIKKGISFSNAPGIAYEYSNMGFAMQGYIIKKVTGMPYSDYIEKYIWKPLGMQQAQWEYTKVPANELAHGYRWVNDDWKEEALLHDGIYGAMGGMITSIESFSKYMALHQQAWPVRNDADAGPLKRSSLREMHQPWRFASLNAGYRYPSGRACAQAAAYAYGLRWAEDCEGRETVGHTGGLPGFGSNWSFAPQYGLGVMFFANVTYAPTAFANVMVMDTLLRLSTLQARQLPPSDILTKRRDQLVKLLPDFTGAEKAGIFAENFFADYFTDALKKEANAVFAKAGKILSVQELVPENQLRGHFILEGERANVWVSFTLTPENPALIQEYHIRAIEK
ncbi:MAG: beta-lactamase family protein [Chitinophagaceae bacterium]|nr:beta-lactamase family protein [Chitinophagaceae bacterium]MCA6453802.1 beta-lactamase family protein [Chitinophagaceae bacterium]MCA6460134.1 beta-lactamase family protein [Chitinophagaceae bacterium]MCA6464042.1 beta-lactamase family protein [Chitinophagaceae bacterium]